jgi:hypothetical protein
VNLPAGTTITAIATGDVHSLALTSTASGWPGVPTSPATWGTGPTPTATSRSGQHPQRVWAQDSVRHHDARRAARHRACRAAKASKKSRRPLTRAGLVPQFVPAEAVDLVPTQPQLAVLGDHLGVPVRRRPAGIIGVVLHAVALDAMKTSVASRAGRVASCMLRKRKRPPPIAPPQKKPAPRRRRSARCVACAVAWALGVAGPGSPWRSRWSIRAAHPRPHKQPLSQRDIELHHFWSKPRPTPCCLTERWWSGSHGQTNRG